MFLLVSSFVFGAIGAECLLVWPLVNRIRNILVFLELMSACCFLFSFVFYRNSIRAAVNYGEVIGSRIWNRSENELYLPGDAISPQLTPGIPRLPYEVNVIGFYPTDPATSAPIFRNNVTFATASTASAQIFYSGWGKIDLSPPLYPINETRAAPQGESGIVFNFYNNFFSAYRGLPALGIVMTEFYNGSSSGYYGNTVPWQYSVDWSNIAVP